MPKKQGAGVKVQKKKPRGWRIEVGGMKKESGVRRQEAEKQKSEFRSQESEEELRSWELREDGRRQNDRLEAQGMRIEVGGWRREEKR